MHNVLQMSRHENKQLGKQRTAVFRLIGLHQLFRAGWPSSALCMPVKNTQINPESYKHMKRLEPLSSKHFMWEGTHTEVHVVTWLSWC